MNLEDRLTALDVGKVDIDLTVKPSGTEQRTVEDIGTVCSRHDDDTLVRLEAVHLDEDLIEGLFTFVVSASEARTSLPTDGIDFIDEDDTGLIPLCHIKKVAHTRGTDTDIHLHEVGTADREERNTRFSRNGLCKQRFTCSGRTYEQDALRNFCAKIGELFGALEEFDDFLQFLFFLFRSGDIGEAHFNIGRYARLCLAEAHHLSASAAHRAKNQEECNNPDHKDGNVQDIPPSGTGVRVFKRNLNAHIHPVAHIGCRSIIKARADGGIGIRSGIDIGITIEIVAADDNFIDLLIVGDFTRCVAFAARVLDQFDKLIICAHFLCVDLRRYHEVRSDPEHRNQYDNDNRFYCLTQSFVSF